MLPGASCVTTRPAGVWPRIFACPAPAFDLELCAAANAASCCCCRVDADVVRIVAEGDAVVVRGDGDDGTEDEELPTAG